MPPSKAPYYLQFGSQKTDPFRCHLKPITEYDLAKKLSSPSCAKIALLTRNEIVNLSVFSYVVVNSRQLAHFSSDGHLFRYRHDQRLLILQSIQLMKHSHMDSVSSYEVTFHTAPFRRLVSVRSNLPCIKPYQPKVFGVKFSLREI